VPKSSPRCIGLSEALGTRHVYVDWESWLREAIPAGGRHGTRYEVELEKITQMLANEDDATPGESEH
jgi:hypothetical protein